MKILLFMVWISISGGRSVSKCPFTPTEIEDFILLVTREAGYSGDNAYRASKNLPRNNEYILYNIARRQYFLALAIKLAGVLSP
jgi:hypothetical protein